MTKLYREQEGVRSICKQLMSLNFIPWQKVLVCWENLVQKGKDLKLKRCDAEKLVKFLRYVKFYLIQNNTWPPSTWCVFMQSIRTNNDTEGWHTRLHKHRLRPPTPGRCSVLLLIMSFETKACGNPACSVPFTTSSNSRKFCSNKCYPSVPNRAAAKRLAIIRGKESSSGRTD
jgi:hypothetical protein